MNRDRYKPLVWLMWLALPSTALNYWRAWDRLPMRMAVHFDANWNPNGYTSREGSLMLGLGITAFMLFIFTIAAYIVRAQKPSASWLMLATFYLAVGLLWSANNWIVSTNLYRVGRQPAVNLNVPTS
jgi:cytochrome bd-type quinol oxidase subunit 1